MNKDGNRKQADEGWREDNEVSRPCNVDIINVGGGRRRGTGGKRNEVGWFWKDLRMQVHNFHWGWEHAHPPIYRIVYTYRPLRGTPC